MPFWDSCTVILGALQATCSTHDAPDAIPFIRPIQFLETMQKAGFATSLSRTSSFFVSASTKIRAEDYSDQDRCISLQDRGRTSSTSLAPKCACALCRALGSLEFRSTPPLQESRVSPRTFDSSPTHLSFPCKFETVRQSPLHLSRLSDPSGPSGEPRFRAPDRSVPSRWRVSEE
jgi:hypothetical protein